MSEGKCEFIGDNFRCGDNRKTCLAYSDEGYTELCEDKPNCLYKQLQTAKEEKEKLKEIISERLSKGKMEVIDAKIAIENFVLTQQNKQMKEALEKITNLDAQENDFVDLYYSSLDLAQQALKGVE